MRTPCGRPAKTGRTCCLGQGQHATLVEDPSGSWPSACVCPRAESAHVSNLQRERGLQASGAAVSGRGQRLGGLWPARGTRGCAEGKAPSSILGGIPPSLAPAQGTALGLVKGTPPPHGGPGAPLEYKRRLGCFPVVHAAAEPPAADGCRGPISNAVFPGPAPARSCPLAHPSWAQRRGRGLQAGGGCPLVGH